MAWKPAMKSEAERGGALVADVGGIKNPRIGCASDLADVGRSSAVPVHDLAGAGHGGAVPLQNRAGGVQIRGNSSQFELHAIVGDFEAGIYDGAVFGRAVVEDGICVVDVNQDAAGAGVGWEECEQAVFAGEWEMAHVAGFLFAAAGFDEFVVAPEGAIEESDAAL